MILNRFEFTQMKNLPLIRKYAKKYENRRNRDILRNWKRNKKIKKIEKILENEEFARIRKFLKLKIILQREILEVRKC